METEVQIETTDLDILTTTSDSQYLWYSRCNPRPKLMLAENVEEFGIEHGPRSDKRIVRHGRSRSRRTPTRKIHRSVETYANHGALEQSLGLVRLRPASRYPDTPAGQTPRKCWNSLSPQNELILRITFYLELQMPEVWLVNEHRDSWLMYWSMEERMTIQHVHRVWFQDGIMNPDQTTMIISRDENVFQRLRRGWKIETCQWWWCCLW